MKALILTLLLASCSMRPLSMNRFQSRDEIFESWLGQPSSDLVRHHGKPHKIVFTAFGRIMVYEGAWKKDMGVDAELQRSWVKFTVSSGIVTKWESNMAAFILFPKRE